MKRIAIALALVAVAATACKKADQSGQMAGDTSAMMADSAMMAGDTTHMMAPDTVKK